MTYISTAPTSSIITPACNAITHKLKFFCGILTLNKRDPTLNLSHLKFLYLRASEVIKLVSDDDNESFLWNG